MIKAIAMFTALLAASTGAVPALASGKACPSTGPDAPLELHWNVTPAAIAAFFDRKGK